MDSYSTTTEMILISEGQISNYTCETAEESFNLRQICVESSRPPDVCFPRVISNAGSNFVGIWCAFHAAIGFAGNILTLVAIPYAIRHKRYWRVFWRSTQICHNFFCRSSHLQNESEQTTKSRIIKHTYWEISSDPLIWWNMLIVFSRKKIFNLWPAIPENSWDWSKCRGKSMY